MRDDVLLEAAGALRQAYGEVDWSATAVGPVSEWTPALRGTFDLILNSRFPMTLFWGPDFVLVYNEAYVRLIADKHPSALGAPAHAVFPEAWETIGPLMRNVLAGHGGTWNEDAFVPLERHGRLAEAYFTFSYSPVRAADGTIEGVLSVATETTRNVIDRRRLHMLVGLHELLGDLESADEVPRRALPLLRANGQDLPAVTIGSSAAGTLDEAWRQGYVVTEEAGGQRWGRFPLGSGRDRAERPAMAVRLSEQLAPDASYLGFLRLIASSLGQALDRIDAREAERHVAAVQERMSEALQRSLLTTPLQPDHLQVAVRYLPAAEQAEVGGDWYDSFMGPDGSLRLVVGDVTGHDRRAAAAMAQVRNLLRGVSYTLQASPARVLSALDEAMHGLAVGVYATAILAQVEQDESDVARGLRTLRWSNAGHPPAVLLAPDGRTRLLEARPDRLLGLGGGERADHTVTLEPGASVVFYTDGLVERRRIPLQERLEWLCDVLTGLQDLSAEELSDHLLAQLDDTVEDDVALLVLRAYPEEGPRPPEAGPPVVAADLRAGAR